MACLMLTECATTTNTGNSPGCAAYGEARLTLPIDELTYDALSDWIGRDLDPRMTAAIEANGNDCIQE